jgi:hypothetical protein
MKQNGPVGPLSRKQSTRPFSLLKSNFRAATLLLPWTSHVPTTSPIRQALHFFVLQCCSRCGEDGTPVLKSNQCICQCVATIRVGGR